MSKYKKHKCVAHYDPDNTNDPVAFQHEQELKFKIGLRDAEFKERVR